ncbi:MAG: type II toxin-antitoxin system death-on-curing family toxin [Patescibacteria group bacterium]
MKIITITEIEYVVHVLANELMRWDEPIPDFESRFPHVLESCLRVPFQTFSGKKLYKGLNEKTAILFYLIIKNHPFQNGNKRIAMTALFYFLYKNKKWLKVDNQELYNFARWVAASNPKIKTETVAAIQKFIKTYVTDL